MNNLLIVSKRFLKKNASTILTYAGGIGVATTAVLAVKATPKALILIEELKREKGEDLTKLEAVRIAGPVYIPAALTGVATIACIFGANTLNKRKQASLISGYALLDRSFKDYKNKVEELYGTEATGHITEEIAKDIYEEEDEFDIDDDKQLFYDEFSRRYFQSTIEDVQRAEYRLNREINMRGWFELNEFYELLDIPPLKGGEGLGWSEGGNLYRYWQGWVDFNHSKVVMDDGLECYIVTFFQEPYHEYDEYC